MSVILLLSGFLLHSQSSAYTPPPFYPSPSFLSIALCPPPPLPPALLRSDESKPAAINSGSVGEMTASDDFPCSKSVHPWQKPKPLCSCVLSNFVNFNVNTIILNKDKTNLRSKHLDNCTSTKFRALNF